MIRFYYSFSRRELYILSVLSRSKYGAHIIMKKFNKCPLRTAIVVGLSSSLFFTGQAFAQEQNESNSGENLRDVEKIAVTGSRIRSADVTAATPLQTIDAESLQDQAVINVQEALQYNPAFGIAGASRSTSNDDITTVGSATVNLRNLGADRTLVLVNGKRMVASSPGTTQVDLSMVPTEFIDRVEVLTGGASAVYGSDAVAGVVNIIYKKDFEGLVFNSQAGISEEGDDEQYKFDLTAGHNFDNDRGNFMINVGWSRQGEVRSSDRDRTSEDYTSLGHNNRDPATVFEPTISRSGVIAGGVVNSGGVNYTFDSAGNAVVWNGTQEERFNRRPYKTIVSPVDRFTVALRSSYDVSEDHTLFIESNYGLVTTSGYAEPSPFVANNDVLGIGENINVENYILNPATGETTLTQNPFLPQIIIDNATDSNNDGLRDVGLNRRLTQFGPNGLRDTPTERELFRVVLGSEGYLNDNWEYDLHYSYGRTTLDGRMDGLFHGPNLKAALTVAQDVYDLDGDGSTTDAICVDADARGRGCVPVNFYGEGTMTPEMLAYVEGSLYQNAVQDMQVISANVTGEVFELPAGALAIAAGIEYREESSEHYFDPLTNGNMNGYIQHTDTAGELDVSEVYIEAVAPVIDGVTLNAAYRLSDYSTVGAVSAYNAGIEWSATEELRFRAVYAHAVRAPNIGELFAAESVSTTSITDPCEGITNADTGALAENCRAAAGVQQNIDENGSLTLNQSDVQGVGLLSTNNPGIKEETAKSYTIGAVYTPTSDLSFSLDYYDIEIEDAISRVNPSVILDKCYNDGIASFCEFVDRRPAAATPWSAGSVEQVTVGLVNSGGQWTKGFDVTARYTTEMFSGDVSLDFSWTHLLEKGLIPLEGEAADRSDGEVGDAENKAFIAIGYQQGAWNMNLITRYIGESYLDDTYWMDRYGADAGKDNFKIDAKVYADAQVNYFFDENYTVTFGIKNLFDTTPPPIIGGLPGGSADTGTAAGVYDAIGRSFYAGLRVSF